jgi:hypothetical protein
MALRERTVGDDSLADYEDEHALFDAVDEAVAQGNVEGLRRALRFAAELLLSYRADLRNSAEHVGVDLAARGFCQGTIYTNGFRLIRAALNRPL